MKQEKSSAYCRKCNTVLWPGNSRMGLCKDCCCEYFQEQINLLGTDKLPFEDLLYSKSSSKKTKKSWKNFWKKEK